MIDKIKEANSKRYSNPEEVDGYLTEPYHSLRSSIGIIQLNKEVKLIKNTNEKVRILELAASTGKVAKKIQDSLNTSVIASDIEYLPLTYSRKLLSNELGSNCIQLDATIRFPFVDSSFAGIYMGELIEHLFDTKLLLSECNRVLITDGVLIITTPNLAALQDRIGFIFGKAPRHVNPLHEYLRLHIRPFTFGLLKDVLEATGFKVISIKSNYVRVRFDSGKHIDSRILARLFPTLGGSLIVAAKKI